MLGELDHRIIATVGEPLSVLDGDLRVISVNDSFYRPFKVLRRWTEGRLFFETGNRQWDRPHLRILLEKMLLTDQQFQDSEVDLSSVTWSRNRTRTTLLPIMQ